MLTVIFVIQCDICGDFYEKQRSSNQPDPTLWSLLAGSLQETCGTEDFWFFNPKTRKHWCFDCRTEWEEYKVLAPKARSIERDGTERG
jgi:hypothetical protein